MHPFWILRHGNEKNLDGLFGMLKYAIFFEYVGQQPFGRIGMRYKVSRRVALTIDDQLIF